MCMATTCRYVKLQLIPNGFCMTLTLLFQWIYLRHNIHSVGIRWSSNHLLLLGVFGKGSHKMEEERRNRYLLLLYSFYQFPKVYPVLGVPLCVWPRPWVGLPLWTHGSLPDRWDRTRCPLRSVGVHIPHRRYDHKVGIWDLCKSPYIWYTFAMVDKLQPCPLCMYTYMYSCASIEARLVVKYSGKCSASVVNRCPSAYMCRCLYKLIVW